jgi:uncharacterized membrane protein
VAEVISTPRIQTVDALRGIALACMAVYHFSWDLEFFGLAELGVTEHLPWLLFAKAIAATFLFTVGVSLHLAHSAGVRSQPFLRRLGLIALAAAAITAASWWFDPEGTIWFGILHCIAVSSLIGILFLRAHPALTAIAAVAALAAPLFLTTEALNHPGWLWLGLSREFPPANDYIPLLPWTGFVLAGIVFAQITRARVSDAKLAAWHPRNALSKLLTLVGRHSLLIYLVHQPLLIGALSVYARMTG